MYNEFDQNITKESDPVRQKHCTTKKHWLVGFTGIFLLILKLFLHQRPIPCFCWYFPYWHWNLHIPSDSCIGIFSLLLQENRSMHFILPVLMRKRITHDSWIQRQELLCTWSRTIWRLSQFSFALTILRSQSPAQIAYVTSAGKENTAKRLFSSTVFPEELQIFCAWQEKEPLNHTGSNWMKHILLFLYSFR